MGKFSEYLAARMSARRKARGVQHPRGYTGTVMWCPTCSTEVLRIPAERVATLAEQQRAVDVHALVCGKVRGRRRG